MGNVTSVNTGKRVEVPWARRGQTAIGKFPVAAGAAVTKLGLEGDEQTADFHGGVLQAVYAYAREDLDWWSGLLDRELRDGVFGENVDLVGFDVTGAVLAERWRVGDVLLEVTAPRMACGTFGGWMDEKGWAKRFNGARRPGAYLRVLEEGTIRPGDTAEVVWRPEKRVTIAEAVSAILDDHDILRRILDMAEDVPTWDRAAMMFHVSNRTRSAAKEKSVPPPAPHTEGNDARHIR
ncbi:MOSC domain-containing protein [Streptomyces sp. AJS327]|uniref:MOSC domain-containing protein n=1 Tax=Streptomyces sp. AJS327 TaxID=2545265 RepID=UPI0015DF9735|nr:MOSC domain-containing protein [Streptomyces sp. AJS327]MBA0051252.1 MOSC domain-containing protein [Streptomyces sp. AJS327]